MADHRFNGEEESVKREADRIRAVLTYLAELAAVGGTGPRWDVGEMVWLSDAPDRAGRAQLERLRTRDTLHAEESLLREGRLWLCGRVRIGDRDTTVKLPLLERLSTGDPASDDTEFYLHPTFSGDAALSGDPDALEAAILAAAEADESPVLHPEAMRLVDAVVAGADLPAWSLADGGNPDELCQAPALSLRPGRGVYLASDPLGLDRRTVLNTWRTRDLSGSSLAAVYGDGTSGESPGEDRNDRSVISPLPLNAAQTAAVSRADRQPLTVVSGPPGTGKTHVAVAAAINEVAHGGSALVVTQSHHATRAIDEILSRYPMVETLRFGSGESIRTLGNRLAEGVPPVDPDHDPRRLQRRLDDLEAEMEARRDTISAVLSTVGDFGEALGVRLTMPLWLASADGTEVDLDRMRTLRKRLDAKGPLAGWRRRRAGAALRRLLSAPSDLDAAGVDGIIAAVAAERLVSSSLGRPIDLTPLVDELAALEEEWRSVVGRFLEAERRRRAGRASRAALGELATALRTGGESRRRLLLSMTGDFLDVVPLWLGTLGDVERLLPVEPGIFDMVILDEASQISQINAAPALARGRRALVVGDLRQLRHVSFVSDAAQAAAAATAGIEPGPLLARIDERRNSIFDAAAAAAPVIQLEEHFRSVPHLIRFSDRSFYDGRLRLMTAHPARETRDAIDVVRVVGDRDDSGVVDAEVTAVLAMIHRHLEGGTGSLGVLSPFRAQADALERAVLDALSGDQIESLRLRVGTVHGFQGTERDHIVISLGLGPADRGALRFVEDPSLFNVMVTRARERLTIVTALDPEALGEGLLREYLRHGEEPPLAEAPRLSATGWKGTLASAIASFPDVRVVTDYRVAGWTVDIAVGTGAAAFGVEAGCHPDGPDAHIERRLALRRAGWDVVDMYEPTWYGRPEEAATTAVTHYRRRHAAR